METNLFQNLDCVICLEKINTECDISITKCQHTFHTSCLLTYGKENCPYCRQIISSANYNFKKSEEVIRTTRTRSTTMYSFSEPHSQMIERLTNSETTFFMGIVNKTKKIIYDGIYTISKIIAIIVYIHVIHLITTVSLTVFYEILRHVK